MATGWSVAFDQLPRLYGGTVLLDELEHDFPDIATAMHLSDAPVAVALNRHVGDWPAAVGGLCECPQGNHHKGSQGQAHPDTPKDVPGVGHNHVSLSFPYLRSHSQVAIGIVRMTNLKKRALPPRDPKIPRGQVILGDQLRQGPRSPWP
jgi:hypothetical protein